jgi:hypothetical protein
VGATAGQSEEDRKKAGRKAVTDSVMAQVVSFPFADRSLPEEKLKRSALALAFDKPDTLFKFAQSPSLGLQYSARGVDAVESEPGKLTNVAGPALYELLSPERRAALRQYALLTYVLMGNPADMATVRDGAWELDRMFEQLKSSPTTARQASLFALSYWRRAEDPATKEPYWYNVVDGKVQWQEPKIDGKGPYEWFPYLPGGPTFPSMK